MLKTRRPVYKWLFKLHAMCWPKRRCLPNLSTLNVLSNRSLIHSRCRGMVVPKVCLLPFPQTDVACSQATWLPWKNSLQGSLLREWVISELPLRLTSVSKHRKVQRHWYENNGFILMQIKVIITSFCTYKPHLRGKSFWNSEMAHGQ